MKFLSFVNTFLKNRENNLLPISDGKIARICGFLYDLK